jgi:hypothetical protein
MTRNPDEIERGLLDAMLARPFPGSAELARQLRSVTVEPISGERSVRLIPSASAPAAVVRHRVPVEAVAEDTGGVVIHALLHVVRGVAEELEFFREDGEEAFELPPLQAWLVR